MLTNARTSLNRTMLVCELYKRFKRDSFRYKHIVEQANIHGTGDGVVVRALVTQGWVDRLCRGEYRLTQKSLDLVELVKRFASDL